MSGSVMQAEADAHQSEHGPDGGPDANPRTGMTASRLWLGVGLMIAIVTVLSGIAATVFQFHDDAEIQR
ncbi:MAG: hypothetical protein OEW83_03620, partial [Acidimicrobiia bacterium]|nr:hypothetical protein [Acidimicrobiia bacterium]